MKSYPNDSFQQSKENIRELNKIVKSRWKNITKAMKALGMRISRKSK
jgi:hypothetical protein